MNDVLIGLRNGNNIATNGGVVMNRTARSIVCIAVLLSGCGPGVKQISYTVGDFVATGPKSSCTAQGSRNIFSAAPICTQYQLNEKEPEKTAAEVDNEDANAPVAGTNVHKNARLFIGAALTDSFTKCSQFITTFTGAQSGENTFLDITALTLSALGSAFVPVGTVHALSAASTIVQGTKSAINSDLFQQLTVQIFIQQINSTYFKEFNDFAGKLTPTSEIFASQALPQIEFFHKDCSIVFAAANLASSAKAPNSSSSIQAGSLIVGAKFKALNGTMYQVTALAPAGGTPTSVTYTAQPTGGVAGAPQTAPTDALLALLNQQSAQPSQ